MKKLLVFIISSLFLTSFVSAEETTTLGIYRDFDKVITDIYADNSIYQTLINKYRTYYESTYPYFIILSSADYKDSTTYIGYSMILFPSSFDFSKLSSCLPFDNYYSDLGLCYDNQLANWADTGVSTFRIDKDKNFSNLLTLTSHNIFYYSTTGSFFSPFVYSNFDIPLTLVHTYSFPSFSSSSHDISFQYFELTEGNNLPTYLSLYEGDYTPGVSYTTINLNNYDYVALSLRDYTQTQAFSTNFIVEGQLCLTPVYNYGMTEKTGAGYKVQRCSPVYSTPSPMRVDIIENDLKNHAIYYLKAYNTSISNIIKVDSSIFNITYIDSLTSQPYINVNGVQYPAIPYSQLTSSATLSESEGYVSGEVTNVFDATGDSEFIENLFSNPLETLKSTWATILTMFGLIGSFINLLPEVLQAFLYTTLALALTIGIIKILT